MDYWLARTEKALEKLQGLSHRLNGNSTIPVLDADCTRAHMVTLIGAMRQLQGFGE